MKGHLELRAGVRDGRTVLLESCGSYPLQVMRPQVVAGTGGLSLVVLLLSAGLLDGDELAMDVCVEPGARLAVRTQAATQVHAGHSKQRLRATVCADGWFSYVPHALVPHAGTDHVTETVVRMEPRARVLVADALSPGRAASGEEFAYSQVRLDLDAWYGDRLVARERATVRPDPALRATVFGEATHTAVAYLLGPGESPRADEADGDIRVGVSMLAHGGWYVRVLGKRASEVDQVLANLQAHWWLG